MKKIKYSSKLKVWWYKLIYPTVNFEFGYQYKTIKWSDYCSLKTFVALVRWEISNGWERIYIGECPFTDKVVCWLRKSNEEIV
jgi:hypothetical protein